MFRKTESISVKEFMNRRKSPISDMEKETFKKGKTAGLSIGLSLLPLAFAPLTKVKQVFAETLPVVQTVPVIAAGDMSSKLMTAFDPLIELVQSLAYPVAMVVALGGTIMVMIGQKEKGYSMMMSAGLGIILINICPMVLGILVGAMKSVV